MYFSSIKNAQAHVAFVLHILMMHRYELCYVIKVVTQRAEESYTDH